MDRYSYKCVPAPRRPRKRKGDRTPADALAGAMEAIMTEQASQGWEYLRCDTLPVEARRGPFSALTETRQAVLVFRKAIVAERATPVPQGPAPKVNAPIEPPALGAARLD